MFDISQLDCATAADEGREMTVSKPNGEYALDNDGNPVTITLYGRLSLKQREVERRLSDLRAEKAALGQKRTIDDVDRENTEMLVALTKGWSFTELDGQPFPFNESNARRFWGDRRFTAIREQAVRFINTDANFMKG